MDKNIKKIESLPDAELDIMFVIWKNNEPLKANEIVNKLSETRDWKMSTAHTLLSRLEEKGFIVADRQSHAHLFSLAISEEEYRGAQSKSLLSRLCDGSVKKMIASLIDGDNVTDKEIDEIKEILRSKQEELKNSKK